MSHGVTSSDSMFSVSADRRPPWHGLGAVLDERPASLPSALEAARLDWRVVQVPLYRLDGLDGLDGAAESEVQKLRGNVRADTGALLGVVSADYRVVQNMEAFAFLANLIGSELHFETAGSLWGGKAVWMLAELPDHVEVGGDAVRRFVLVTTRHDGTAAVRALVTPIRVVCANTLRVAIGGARDTYRVRHLGDPTGALHEARGAGADDRLPPAVRRARRPAGEPARGGAHARTSAGRALPRRPGARGPGREVAPRRARDGDDAVPRGRDRRQRAGLEVGGVERDRRVPRPRRAPADRRGRFRPPLRGPGRP